MCSLCDCLFPKSVGKKETEIFFLSKASRAQEEDRAAYQNISEGKVLSAVMKTSDLREH